MTALLDVAGGYGRGRQQKFQNDLEQEQVTSQEQYQQEQLNEQKRIDALNARQAGYDPDTLQPLPIIYSQTQIHPNNKSKGGAGSLDDTVNLYASHASDAIKANRPDLAKYWQNQIAAVTQGGLRTSEQTLNLQGKLPLDKAQAGRAHAEAFYANNRLRVEEAIAKGHDAASIQRVTDQIQGRRELAQYDAQAKAAIAQRAALYHLQYGVEVTAAIARANQEYQGGLREYLQQTMPRNPLYAPYVDPNAPGAQMPQYPAININVGQQPGGLAPIPIFNRDGTITGGAEVPTVNNADDGTQSVLSRAKAALESGKFTADQIRQSIEHGVGTRQITQAQANQIMRALNIAPSGGGSVKSGGTTLLDRALQPPPIGGSQDTARPSHGRVTFLSDAAYSGMATTSPKLRVALAQVMAPFNPAIGYVRNGIHEKGSAHYDGRAVDIDAFGNTPVGYNEVTWQAVMTAIESQAFPWIGTIAAIAKNPAAQAFARHYGVTLAQDDKHGAHLHLQVNP